MQPAQTRLKRKAAPRRLYNSTLMTVDQAIINQSSMPARRHRPRRAADGSPLRFPKKSDRNLSAK
jgi:hypothetical protein